MYHTLKKSAQKYGESKVRPQDIDKQLLIAARSNNLGVKTEVTEEIAKELRSVAKEFEIHKKDLPKVSSHQRVIWVDESTRTPQITEDIFGSRILSIDFELHNADSYDGFICVASVARDYATYVIDCLFESRNTAKEEITRALRNPNQLKVFCGCDQDMIRIKQDWQCIPTACVDIQDMFVAWRNEYWENCIEVCRNVIEDKIKTKPNVSVEEYLRTYDKPGLEFLMKILPGLSVPDKNKAATFADFRCRPLHRDLIRYAADDATYTLLVFNFLANKIKLEGIRKTMEMCVRKIQNTARVPQYQQLKAKPVEDFVSVQVKKWCEYLSKNMDKSPTTIISDRNMKRLVNEVSQRNLASNEPELSKLLADLQIDDDSKKSASLLMAFLDPSQKELQKMQQIVCHRCNEVGHSAKFCFRLLSAEEERERKREFRKRPEMKERNHAQYDRRWMNYCKKRNLDPTTAEKPWE